jgi:predicted nucleic acid-binding protein
MPESQAERLLCDTSFVAFSAKQSYKPERFAHWPKVITDRINNAILAMSVVTLAEARFGYRRADWGPSRIAREEKRLTGFLQIPLDTTILDEWARLKDLCVRAGVTMSDNDYWIAATASSRSYPLITCDRDQTRIPDQNLPVLYLAPPR